MTDNSTAEKFVVHADHDLYFDLNFIAYLPHGLHANSKTSAFILREAFSALPMDEAWIRVINRIQDISGVGNTVWGIKNEGGRFSLEFYFYYPKRYESHSFESLKSILKPFLSAPFPSDVEMGGYECLSFNIESLQVAGLNVYYMEGASSSSSIKARSCFLAAGSSEMQKVNTYHALLKESGFHQDGFHFSDASKKVEEYCRHLFPDEDASLAEFYRSYSYLQDADRLLSPIGFAEKAAAIGLYFMGLSIKQFIGFLRAHDYPAAFIEHIFREEGNLSHLRYDVGIDFSLEGGRVVIKKTAFFGSV